MTGKSEESGFPVFVSGLFSHRKCHLEFNVNDSSIEGDYPDFVL